MSFYSRTVVFELLYRNSTDMILGLIFVAKSSLGQQGSIYHCVETVSVCVCVCCVLIGLGREGRVNLTPIPSLPSLSPAVS